MEFSLCEVASYDSLLCKPFSNWSPSVRSCLYRVSYVMCNVIDNPTSCKICADKLFLHTKNMSAAEMHRE
jgi:hypothetical protein